MAHVGCCSAVSTIQNQGYPGTLHAVSAWHSTQLAQAGEQECSNRQQMPESGPELRLRLESTDSDCGRSLTALLSTKAAEGGPQLCKACPVLNTCTLGATV